MRWAPIGGFPGYWVSDTGMVGRQDRWGDMVAHALSENDSGVMCVWLTRNRRQFRPTVARLVHEAFIGPVAPGHVVVPVDGDKTNLAAPNLRAQQRPEVTGRRPRPTIAQVIQIRDGYRSGVKPLALAAQHGMAYRTVLRIAEGVTYR